MMALLVSRNVDHSMTGTTAGLLDTRDLFLQSGFVDVKESDVSSLVCHPSRDACADTARPACDDRNLILESLHFL